MVEEPRGLEIAKWWRDKRAGDCKVVEEPRGLEIAKWWRNQEGWRLQSGGGTKKAGDCKVVER